MIDTVLELVKTVTAFLKFWKPKPGPDVKPLPEPAAHSATQSSLPKT